MATTTAGADFELIAADGVTPIPLMLVAEVDRNGVAQPKRVAEALAASNAESPLADWLEPVSQEDWSRGFGLDYAEAPGCHTRTPGFVVPAGRSVDVTVPAVGNSNSSIVAIAEYAGNVYLAQQGTPGVANARMLVSVGGTAALTQLAPPVFLANELISGMAVFDDGAGTPCLWVGTGNYLWRFNGTTWQQSPPMVRTALARVFWTTNDGVGAPRMIAISGFDEIAYTLPDSNPLLAASWVEGVRMSTQFSLTTLAASRHHMYALSAAGVFDLQANGDAPNIVSYLETTLTASTLPTVPAIILEGWLYYGLAQGLDRVWVGAQEQQLQQTPGICSPGWGTEAEHRWPGLTTALTVDQGWLVNAVWNPSTGRAGIFWGRDREALGVETPNPLVWHGPEIHTDESMFVTAMLPSWRAGALQLWIAGRPPAGGPPTVAKVSLPLAGSPVDDLMSGGGHRFATGVKTSVWQPNTQIWSLGEYWRDKVAQKILFEHTVGSRGLGTPDATTKADLFLRADPLPGSVAWGTSVPITVSPSKSIEASTPNQGTKLQWRLDLYNPHGADSPPQIGLIDAVQRTAWRVVPTFRVKTLDVEYGDDVLGVHNANDGASSPLTTKDLLEALTEAPPTVLRDRLDQRWRVKLRQVLDSEDTYTEGTEGVRSHSRIVLAVLGRA